jgi:acetyl-CoA acetyltransferase
MDIEGRMGILFAGIYSMRVRTHMEKYGITREHLALTAVKNQFHGSLNPHSQYQKPVTTEEVLESRMIADPITLLMTCPLGDGAAAVVVGTREMARRTGKRPIRIASSVLGSFGFPGPEDPTIAARISGQAYKEAGITSKDVQVAEVHDAVSPIELYLMEEMGLCEPGESGSLTEERQTWFDGGMPINTSGGLTAKGHPAGATGIAQVAELAWQMRGEAGKRQITPAPTWPSPRPGGGRWGGRPPWSQSIYSREIDIHERRLHSGAKRTLFS